MITLTDIQALPSVVDDLAWPFDLNLGRASHDNAWIRLVPEKRFIVVAGESGGGVFLAYGDGKIESMPILYATSEGQAGRVASNLTELLAMMMAIPYWRDLLKFSGAGNLDEMRRTVEFMAREYAEEYPGLASAKKRIMDALPIPAIPDPVQLLHDCIHATDCSLVADDGWRYESLFNNFKSSDNPDWI